MNNSQIAAFVRSLIEQRGFVLVQKATGLTREALARVAGGLPAREGSYLQAAKRLGLLQITPPEEPNR